MAVRLPFPEGGKQWTDDRVTILQALGVLDPNGKPTGRLDVVKAADVARPTQEAFDKERAKMLETCTRCHGASFAKEHSVKATGSSATSTTSRPPSGVVSAPAFARRRGTRAHIDAAMTERVIRDCTMRR